MQRPIASKKLAGRIQPEVFEGSNEATSKGASKPVLARQFPKRRQAEDRNKLQTCKIIVSKGRACEVEQFYPGKCTLTPSTELLKSTKTQNARICIVLRPDLLFRLAIQFLLIRSR
jgi:hypothetical protein